MALLVGGMLLGSVAAVQAVEIKARGTFDFAFRWGDNLTFQDGPEGGDAFNVKERIRTQINIIASENLQGVLFFEIAGGDSIVWGRANGNMGRNSGGALDSDGVNIATRRAYLDWMVPNTDLAIRMGLQGLALPSATGFGSPIFNTDVAAVTATYAFNDMVSLTGFWARPFDQYDNDSSAGFGNTNLADETDAFGLILPVTGENWNVTPWGMFATVGNASGFYEHLVGGDYDNTINSGSSNPAWWAGVAASLTVIDNLTFAVDVMYGDLEEGNLSPITDTFDFPWTGSTDIGTRGWFVDASLDYKLDWATAGIFGWWSSGDDADAYEDGQYGRIPTVGLYQNGFAPMSFSMPGSVANGRDTFVSESMIGTWGVGVKLADMSFIENLEHTVRVGYFRGTNDHELIENGGAAPRLSYEGVYMTDKDSAIEVDFNHKYQIYENLAAYLELGYIRLDMDEDVWGDNYLDKDCWIAQVIFQYRF